MAENIQIDKLIRNEVYSRIDNQINKFIDSKPTRYTSIAIVGGFGSGKTTILEQIRHTFCMKSDLVVIKINAGYISNPYHFMDEVSIQAGYRPNIKLVEWKDYADNLFNYIHISEKKFLFLIDDAHLLLHYGQELLSYLREKFQVSFNICLIISIAKTEKETFFGYDKAFYGHAYIIELEPLTQLECNLLIESYIHDFENNYKSIICQFSDGNPMLIKMLSTIVSAAPIDQLTSLSYGNLEDSYNYRILKEFKGYIQSILGNDLGPQAKAILKELTLNENITVSALAGNLHLNPSAAITQLKRLIKKGYVEKNGNKYSVKNFIKLLTKDTTQLLKEIDFK